MTELELSALASAGIAAASAVSADAALAGQDPQQAAKNVLYPTLGGLAGYLVGDLGARGLPDGHWGKNKAGIAAGLLAAGLGRGAAHYQKESHWTPVLPCVKTAVDLLSPMYGSDGRLIMRDAEDLQGRKAYERSGGNVAQRQQMLARADQMGMGTSPGGPVDIPKYDPQATQRYQFPQSAVDPRQRMILPEGQRFQSDARSAQGPAAETRRVTAPVQSSDHYSQIGAQEIQRPVSAAATQTTVAPPSTPVTAPSVAAEPPMPKAISQAGKTSPSFLRRMSRGGRFAAGATAALGLGGGIGYALGGQRQPSR